MFVVCVRVRGVCVCVCVVRTHVCVCHTHPWPSRLHSCLNSTKCLAIALEIQLQCPQLAGLMGKNTNGILQNI